MGIGPYDADIRISILESGTVVHEMGYAPQDNSRVLASLQRIVEYANKTAVARIRVWKAE